MKKYIVLYHAPASFKKKMKNCSSEEHREMEKEWMHWMKKCGEGLVDMGAPLGGGMKITKKGSEPSRENVVGYSILKAENMRAAKKMLKNHPHLKWANSCDIEVHESMPMKM